MPTDVRAGAEINRGKEYYEIFSAELTRKLGFPGGVLPMGELEEIGRVKSTGFDWWKCKAPCEHFNEATKINYSYAAEITAYVNKGKMKKMTVCKAGSLPDEEEVDIV